MAFGQGDAFPDLPVRDAEAQSLSVPVRAAGRPAVVYFYPRDDTPGCSKEAQDFERLRPDFTALGVGIFGVSVDDAASHRRFATRHGLGFPLLIDEGGVLARTLGILSPGGRAQRTTYLLDGDGRIRGLWPRVRVDGHAHAVLAEARRLWGAETASR